MSPRSSSDIKTSRVLAANRDMREWQEDETWMEWRNV